MVQLHIESFKNSLYYQQTTNRFNCVNINYVINLPYIKNACGVYYAVDMVEAL